MEVKTKRAAWQVQAILMSILLVAVMLASNLPSASAATAEMSVLNVETGATVKAYKIVGQASDGNWTPVLAGTIANPENPTADEIAALTKRIAEITAQGTTEHPTVIDMGESGSVYKGSGEPGLYMVLVTKTNSSKVYNPMIVAVNYKEGATLEGGSVDANSSFTYKTGAITNTAYAKSSTPKLDKKIVEKPNNGNVTGDGTANGDTSAKDDTVKFEITTVIPSYSPQYETPVFEISDTVSEGLDNPTAIQVKEGTAPDFTSLSDETDYTLVPGTKGFTIKFKEAYLKKGTAARNITVTYSSKLNDKATVGFDANTNEATLKYSNSPGTTDDSKKKKTYHYTFDIDGSIFGKDNVKGEEIIKVGVDKKSGAQITKKESTGSSQSITPLDKAEFTLYKADAHGAQSTEVAGTAITDTAGKMHFTQLDAGKYFLVETKAPTGYVKDPTPVPVEITANLNTNGTLASYSVKINNNITSTYTANYEGGTTVKTVDKTKDETALFNNYKPGGLPSTGGMGTYLFMVVGGALVAIAIAMYVRNRRRQTEAE